MILLLYWCKDSPATRRTSGFSGHQGLERSRWSFFLWGDVLWTAEVNIRAGEMQFRNTGYEVCLSSYSTVLSFHSSGQDVWDYRRTGVKETRQRGGWGCLMRGRLQVTGVTGDWNQLLMMKYEVWKSTIQSYNLRLNEIWDDVRHNIEKIHAKIG